MNKKQAPTCSFCGRTKNEVGKTFGGPGVYICDKCVFSFTELIFEDDQKSCDISSDFETFLQDMFDIKNLSPEMFGHVVWYVKGAAFAIRELCKPVEKH